MMISLLAFLPLLGTAEKVEEKETKGTRGIPFDVFYLSRGEEVPATVVIPEGEGSFPLVVMAHGHGGSREENIGFSRIAKDLATQGIATIRMDFPGCGDSKEDFSVNNLSNMKEDVITGVTYALENYPINPEKVGILGYSMGGRIAIELIHEKSYPFAAMALLAPAVDTDSLKNVFGGRENFHFLKQTAVESEGGYAPFTTIYGQKQKLSVQWFEDLEKYNCEELLENREGENHIATLVVSGVDDDVVPYYLARSVSDAFHAQIITTPYDGHGYGFYSEDELILTLVSTGIVAFFYSQFQ